MEIKEGYKKTKLGLIPVDWEVVKFNQVADNDIRWSLTGGPFGSDLKSSDYTKSGVRILQLQNIGDGEFKDEYKIYTSEKKADELISCNIYPLEIILSKMGDPVARACMIPRFESRFLMASDGIRLVCNKAKFDNIFVLEYINFNIFRSIAIRRSTGSTRQRIGLKDLKKIPFPLPPLPEQKKIAKILSTWDKAIEKTKQLIEQKKLLKKGLMQQLLTGKVRFGEFVKKKGYKKTKLGIIPKDWNEDLLGTLCGYIKGYAFKSKDYCENGVRVIRISDTNANSIKDDSPIFIPKELAPNFEKWKLFKNDLVFTTVGSRPPLYDSMVGKVIKVEEKHEGSLLNQNAVIIRGKKLINQIFLFNQFKTNRYLKYVETIVRGNANQVSITLNDLFKFKISIPPLPEQMKIAKVLNTCDQAVEKLEEQLIQLQQQKKGLMQQLLTGATRVKVEA